MTIEQAFGLAVQHHQAGRLREAEQIYRQILAQQPRHADAMHLLGVIGLQTGRNDAAVEMIRRALEINPGIPGAHSNLGIALSGQGKPDEAINAFRQAIALNPNDIPSYNNLGNALRGKGQLDDAIAACRQAIALKPDYPDALNNLGNALRDKGQPDEAIAAYREAIGLNPNFPEAHNNLGLLAQAKGQLDEAIAAFRKALALNPRLAGTFYTLGNALGDKGQLEEAASCYKQAVALKPNYPEAYNNLGNALAGIGRVDEAIVAYRQAIAQNGNMPGAYYNLAKVLIDKKLLDEAIAACRQAVALDANSAEAHNNLGNALRTKAQLDEAVAAYRQALSLNPNYPEAYNNMGNALKERGDLGEALGAYQQAVALKPTYVGAHSNRVFALHYHPGYDAASIATEHRRWNRQHAEPLKHCIQDHSNDRTPERPLRIGYFSPDFVGHPVGRFMLPLLANHDKKNVQIFGYAEVPVPDVMTERLRACTDGWRNIVGLSDPALADLIRQDRIDIMVDLAMHAASNRLLVFARKPAPVQVTYLAYCSTTGLDTIDYRLSDPYLDPLGQDESVYSERTVRLPETYWCYQASSAAPAVNATPALEHGHITFGCLNGFSKINDSLLMVWAKLMQATPSSQLLLHAPLGGHRQRVLNVLMREGVDPQRVRFSGNVPLAEYFRLYHQIDIALDTFPYGGGTTTCDTLWMGVPVVCLVGKTAVGRGGVSILSNVGCPELIGQSEQAYVRIAHDLANDLPRLSQLRATLRSRMEHSPLMDAPRFARHVEAAYREMWRKWCAGNSTL